MGMSSNQADKTIVAVRHIHSRSFLYETFRLILWFTALSLYFSLLIILTLLVLPHRALSLASIPWISSLVVVPGLTIFLLFYSTGHTLAIRGLAWKYREFAAAYAFVVLILSVLTYFVAVKPVVSLIVILVLTITTSLLPSIKRVAKEFSQSLWPIFAALILVIYPNSSQTMQGIARSTTLSVSLVREHNFNSVI